MRGHKNIWFAGVVVLLLLCGGVPCRGQNNPYVDDKLFHWGFQLGVNFMSYGITDSNLPIESKPVNGEVLHARVSSMLPGFGVAFVADLRLSKHLNLRITPGLEFASRTISYSQERGEFEGVDADHKKTCDLVTIPLTIPVYLKWSANREMNYRPYVLVGGGVSFNVYPKEDYVQTETFDCFVEGGFGCDFYFSWFKLCPQLTYRVGFMNQIKGITDYSMDQQEIFMGPIKSMLNRELVLTFNFE